MILPKLAKFNTIFFPNIMPLDMESGHLNIKSREEQWLDIFYAVGTESRH